MDKKCVKRVIRVGSRESDLAMYQTRWVIAKIKEKYPDTGFEIVGIKTKGDIILDKTLDKIGGKGLFIKELEQELLDRNIDFAVHSMKDLPADIPEGLVIAAISQREDARDVLVSRNNTALMELKPGAVLGTSSARREVQLRGMRQDLDIRVLRGNVLTRLRKLVNNEYDAVVLAAAGLKRLGLEDRITRYFDVIEMIPAVGQGALAVEARKDDGQVLEMLDCIHFPDSACVVTAEREFMIRLNGGCSTPIAAHGVLDGERMTLYGLLASDDRKKVFRAEITGSRKQPKELGIKLAEKILNRI